MIFKKIFPGTKKSNLTVVMASNSDFHIDHYEEDGFLGAGGFATVYRYRFKGRRATAPPETARLPGRVAVKKLGEQNP